MNTDSNVRGFIVIAVSDSVFVQIYNRVSLPFASRLRGDLGLPPTRFIQDGAWMGVTRNVNGAAGMFDTLPRMELWRRRDG